MQSITTQIRIYILLAIVAVVIGVGVYISVLQGQVERRDTVIAVHKVAAVVESKSSKAHLLSKELEIKIIKAKGVPHEVEINTSIGHHSISFK